VPGAMDGDVSPMEALHQAVTHSNAVVVPISDKQFVWGMRYMYHMKQTPTPAQLKREADYKTASPGELDAIQIFLPLAKAAYATSTAELEQRLLSDPQTAAFKVYGNPDLSGASHVPAHFVATVNRRAAGAQKICVVSIRGTASARIAVKHSLAPAQEMEGLSYRAHSGALEAAHLLLVPLENAIQMFHVEGYRLVITGHSLGGAAAAILGVLLRTRKIFAEVYSYDAPPCVDESLGEVCCDYVTSLVTGDSLIPRLSSYNTAELTHHLATIRWAQVMKGHWWRNLTHAMPEAALADLEEELIHGVGHGVPKTLLGWFKETGVYLRRLVPAGKIVALMRTTEDVRLLLLSYQDPPMMLQVGDYCVSDTQLEHCADLLSQAEINRTIGKNPIAGNMDTGFTNPTLASDGVSEMKEPRSRTCCGGFF